MRRKLIFLVPAAIAGIALFATLGGEIVKWLWNWLLPALFGFPRISFWQALALLALCRILFGGRGGMFQRPASRMSPEERERVRQRLRERFGFGPAARADETSPPLP